MTRCKNCHRRSPVRDGYCFVCAPYDLERPPHSIASQLLGRIAAINDAMFGDESQAIVEAFVQTLVEIEVDVVLANNRYRVEADAYRQAFHAIMTEDENGCWKYARRHKLRVPAEYHNDRMPAFVAKHALERFKKKV